MSDSEFKRKKVTLVWMVSMIRFTKYLIWAYLGTCDDTETLENPYSFKKVSDLRNVFACIG